MSTWNENTKRMTHTEILESTSPVPVPVLVSPTPTKPSGLGQSVILPLTPVNETSPDVCHTTTPYSSASHKKCNKNSSLDCVDIIQKHHTQKRKHGAIILTDMTTISCLQSSFDNNDTENSHVVKRKSINAFFTTQEYKLSKSKD